MKPTRWVLAAAILTFDSGASADERPTAEELLTAFEKSVEKLARVRIEWTRKGEIGERSFDVQTTVFRDGPRWKVDQLVLPKGDNAGRQSLQREQTLIGDDIVRVGWSYQQAGGEPRIRGGMTYFKEQVETRSWVVLFHFAVLFGRIHGDAGYPLWTVMRDSGSLELLPQTEVIDGRETYVLKSQGKYGEHRLWLDPASGGLPRRIEIHKRPGNLLDDYQLGTETADNADAPPTRGRTNPRAAPRPETSSWHRYDNIQIEKKEGVFVITGYESEGRLAFADDNKDARQMADEGQRVKFKYEFQVDVDPKDFPDDVFQFAIAIPNGTSVLVRDKYPLRFRGGMTREHEWVDGKVRERAKN